MQSIDPSPFVGINVDGTKATYRGVRISGGNPDPALPWRDIYMALENKSYYIGPNVVRFLIPEINSWKRDEILMQLTTQFHVAFPDKELPSVRYAKSHERSRSYVDIDTPSSNVAAADIIAAAVEHKWMLAGRPLGHPDFVGPKVPQGLYVLQLSNQPFNKLQQLVKSLNTLFNDHFTSRRGVKMEMVDVYRIEAHIPGSDLWMPANRLVVVVSLPTEVDASAAAYYWPGFIVWDSSSDVIKLEYMNRFDYCRNCKHKAQQLSGPGARHTIDVCPKLVCSSAKLNTRARTDVALFSLLNLELQRIKPTPYLSRAVKHKVLRTSLPIENRSSRQWSPSCTGGRLSALALYVQ